MLAPHHRPVSATASLAQGEGRAVCLIASTPAQADAEAALAAVAPHAACESVEVVWHPQGWQVDIVAGPRLRSLPHVRRLRVQLMRSALFTLALPMPRLEEL